jgi:hypothetical protein
MSIIDLFSLSSCLVEIVTVFASCSQGAGIALRPHLSDLVCCMLESLSSLEDQGLNYVEVCVKLASYGSSMLIFLFS